MRYIIYPYKMNSMSSKRLAAALREQGHNVLRVYPDRNYVPRPDDVIINWGNSTEPEWMGRSYIPPQFLNPPLNVGLATNKLSSFDFFAWYNIPHPENTLHKDIAENWNAVVFARQTLTGCGGAGITVHQPGEELPDAKLYVKAFDKTNEYRVHVFKGEILDCQEKKKRAGTGSREGHHVWNHGNDFVYARDGINIPDNVLDASKKAVQALGLDFGAVDIGYNLNDNTIAVFEVNTAPGLHGTTLIKYRDAICGLH
jgi:hypothetical protein